jgi:hypothetical protein
MLTPAILALLITAPEPRPVTVLDDPLDPQEAADTIPADPERAGTGSNGAGLIDDGDGSAGPAMATAVRAEVAPVLDGRDDDPIWRDAPVHTGFREFSPREDADPRFRTTFRTAFDDRAFYVFIRAYDPHPDSIRRALSRRDVRGPSDQLKIMIDAYHDRRTGVELAVNPDGVKRDYAVFNDWSEDDSWDGVWDVATRVDSLGWTAEFRVPFSQLRYDAAPVQTWGFGVWRDIERHKERVSWPVYRRSQTGLMSQLGELHGIGDIGSPSHIELTPYVLARNLTRAEGDGFGREQEQTVGLDLRYSINSNLTLNATVNPDFGQVEADPAVVNLTAFETFFGERRPFFVEGTGLYRFEVNCYIVRDCGNENLFYSRRIGRSPQLRDEYGDARSPTATPILAAGKLTGRTDGGLSYGVLDAVTQEVRGTDDRTIEPLTNYAVLRVRQDLRDGETGIGLIATGVHRSLDEWSRDFLRRDALVVGGRVRHRFADGRYEVSGSLMASRVGGSAEAIAATQRDNVHGFTRPDGPDRYDPTRTSLTGSAQELIFGKYGGGITRFETAFERQSAGFEPNDLGYLRRADQQTWATWASLVFREPRGIYRSLRINGNQWNTWTTDGLRLEMGANTNAHLELRNSWFLRAGVTINNLGGTFCDRCSRGGPALRNSLSVNGWSGISGDDRKTVVPALWLNMGRSDEGRSSYVSLNPGVEVRLSSRVQASASLDLSRNIDDAQWYDNITDEDGATHYAFARLDQRTLGFDTRLSVAATPDLSLDLYAEPFVSTGTWSDVRELSDDPRAADYDGRFRPYAPPGGADEGFRYLQLRGNAVVRWEYRPGSTVYLVWSHGREHSGDPAADRSWRDDYGTLFDLHPENTFLIKVSYWLGR